jgi:hypothetical protein
MMNDKDYEIRSNKWRFAVVMETTLAKFIMPHWTVVLILLGQGTENKYHYLIFN